MSDRIEPRGSESLRARAIAWRGMQVDGRDLRAERYRLRLACAASEYVELRLAIMTSVHDWTTMPDTAEGEQHPPLQFVVDDEITLVWHRIVGPNSHAGRGDRDLGVLLDDGDRARTLFTPVRGLSELGAHIVRAEQRRRRVTSTPPKVGDARR